MYPRSIEASEDEITQARCEEIRKQLTLFVFMRLAIRVMRFPFALGKTLRFSASIYVCNLGAVVALGQRSRLLLLESVQARGPFMTSLLPLM